MGTLRALQGAPLLTCRSSRRASAPPGARLGTVSLRCREHGLQWPGWPRSSPELKSRFGSCRRASDAYTALALNNAHGELHMLQAAFSPQKRRPGSRIFIAPTLQHLPKVAHVRRHVEAGVLA